MLQPTFQFILQLVKANDFCWTFVMSQILIRSSHVTKSWSHDSYCYTFMTSVIQPIWQVCWHYFRWHRCIPLPRWHSNQYKQLQYQICYQWCFWSILVVSVIRLWGCHWVWHHQCKQQQCRWYWNNTTNYAADTIKNAVNHVANETISHQPCHQRCEQSCRQWYQQSCRQWGHKLCSNNATWHTTNKAINLCHESTDVNSLLSTVGPHANGAIPLERRSTTQLTTMSHGWFDTLIKPVLWYRCGD